MQSVYSRSKSLYLSPPHTKSYTRHTPGSHLLLAVGCDQSSWVTSLSLQLNLACICRGGITLIYCDTVPSPPTTPTLTSQPHPFPCYYSHRNALQTEKSCWITIYNQMKLYWRKWEKSDIKVQNNNRIQCNEWKRIMTKCMSCIMKRMQKTAKTMLRQQLA